MDETKARVGLPEGNMLFDLFYDDIDFEAMARKAWDSRMVVPANEGVNTPQEVVVVVLEVSSEHAAVHYTSRDVVQRNGAPDADMAYMTDLLDNQRPFVYMVCEFASFIMEVPTEAV